MLASVLGLLERGWMNANARCTADSCSFLRISELEGEKRAALFYGEGKQRRDRASCWCRSITEFFTNTNKRVIDLFDFQQQNHYQVMKPPQKVIELFDLQQQNHQVMSPPQKFETQVKNSTSSTAVA